MLPFLSCWYHLCVQINPLIYSPLHPPLLISVGTFLLEKQHPLKYGFHFSAIWQNVNVILFCLLECRLE